MKALLLLFLSVSISINAQPALQWSKKIGSSQFDIISDVTVDQAGNIYVAGTFEDVVDFDLSAATYTLYSEGWNMFVAKYTETGDLLWAKTIDSFGEDQAVSVAVNSNGVYVGTGRLIHLSKFDLNGNFQWTKSFSGTGVAELTDITLDLAGNLILTGTFANEIDFDMGSSVYNLNSNGGDDVFITKIDVYGDFMWARSFGGTSTWDRSRAVKTDKTGNVYLTGNFDETVDFDPGSGTYPMTSVAETDIFILKLNASGDFVWAHQIGGTSFDYGGIDLAIDSAQNVLIAGYFHGTIDFDPGSGTYLQTANGDQDSYILKLNPSGNFLWAMHTDPEELTSIKLDVNNNIYISGRFTGTADFDPGSAQYNLTAANRTGFVSSLNASGKFICAGDIGGAGQTDADAIALDNKGNIIVAGYFSGTTDIDMSSTVNSITSAGSNDAFLAKYTICDAATGIAKINTLPVSIFPNPVNDCINITGLNGAANIRIYNLNGDLITETSFTATSELKLDIKDLADGIYLLNINSADLHETRKLVVSR